MIGKYRYERQEYFTRRERASFYLWCALRGHTIPGNDPITGRKRSRFNPENLLDSREVYKLLYKQERNRAIKGANL